MPVRSPVGSLAGRIGIRIAAGHAAYRVAHRIAHHAACLARFDLFRLQIIHKAAHLAECQHVKPCLSAHLARFVHVLFTFRPLFLLFPLCRHAFAM